MSWTEEGAADQALGRSFTVMVGGQPVPGVYWTPSSEAAKRLVLLGHGGTTHKRADYIMQVAGMLTARGIAAMAIDGPGHGDRATRDDLSQESFEEAWREGGGTDGMLADWRAALDFVEGEEGPRPTGWWGLSMGTMMGLPVAATDPRIRVAVLGLMGNWGPNADDLTRLAPELSCPVRFLVQWDDEIVPRESCLELFDRLGTGKKTLHANPGPHQAVPQFEVNASVDYLDRYVR